MAGPLVGLAAAGGAAYAAATRNDKAGEAAKAVGKAAVAAAQRAAAVDREHQLSQKVGKAAAGAMSTAQDLNSKHGITSRIFGGISSAANKVTETLEGRENKRKLPRD